MERECAHYAISYETHFMKIVQCDSFCRFVFHCVVEVKLKILLDFGKSLIYIMKRSGPIIEPCGTPVVIGKVFDFISTISTY